MRHRHAIGYAVFCLLAGSRWLVDAAWPEQLAPTMAQCIHLLVVGALALAVFSVRRRSLLGRLLLLQVGVAGLLLLGVPALLAELLRPGAAETNAAMSALVPLCVVVGVAFTCDDAVRMLMMPSLLGLTGALLLLHWQLPTTAASAFAVVEILLSVLSMATGSLWMQRLLEGRGYIDALAVFSLANAAFLGGLALGRGDGLPSVSSLRPVLFRSLLFDLPQIVLLLWLVRGMSPEQFAARFFVVPLLTVVEGIIVLRGPLDWRMSLGILLLLYGSATLLRIPHDEQLRLDLSEGAQADSPL